MKSSFSKRSFFTFYHTAKPKSIFHTRSILAFFTFFRIFAKKRALPKLISIGGTLLSVMLSDFGFFDSEYTSQKRAKKWVRLNCYNLHITPTFPLVVTALYSDVYFLLLLYGFALSVA